MRSLISVVFVAYFEFRLMQGTMDDSIFGIHDCRLGVFLQLVSDAFCLFFAYGDDIIAIGQFPDNLLRLTILFK